jgi:predicted ATPase
LAIQVAPSPQLAHLDWSYGLLNETDQLFFRALGIFSGGFTAQAAAAVAADRG